MNRRVQNVALYGYRGPMMCAAQTMADTLEKHIARLLARVDSLDRCVILVRRASAERDLADRAIVDAAAEVGFFVASRFPADLPVDRDPDQISCACFNLPEDETRPLWRQKFDPSHPNVYRGWFPLQRGFLTSKEGIDLGPDVAYGPSVACEGDPLARTDAAASRRGIAGLAGIGGPATICAMVEISQALMRSIARGLALPERFFDDAFDRGLSTLRLLRYPLRSDADEAAAIDPSVWVTHHGQRHYVTGAPHVDSGFLTLLAQDGVLGLQARHRNGEWMDVPPADGTLAVNFGKVLERWSAGRIKATEHRVIGTGPGEACPSRFSTRRARTRKSVRCPMDRARFVRTVPLRRLSVGHHDAIRRVQGHGGAAQALAAGNRPPAVLNRRRRPPL